MINDPADDDNEFLPPTPEQTSYLRRQGNQYAKLSVTLRQPQVSRAAEPRQEQAANKQTVSKEEFESECRRIFVRYIPAAEKGRLRPHHRDFIARNLSRTAQSRHNVLGKLRRYDLSQIPGFEARFNRERAELTETKLKEIEEAVNKEEANNAGIK